MRLLTPENSLRFFKERPPQFLSENDSRFEELVSGLNDALEEREAPNYHAVLLEKGERLLIHIIKKSIAFLSDRYGSPSGRASQFIEKYIQNFSLFEELLFGLNPKYRDHTLHSLWVYLFGHQWITNIGGYNKGVVCIF